MTYLDAIGGILLTVAFVLATAAFAVAFAGPSAVPRLVRRLLDASANGEGLAPAGKTWLALILFGVVAAGILLAEAAFFVRQTSAGRSDRALASAAALVVEGAWLTLLLSRRNWSV